MVICCLLQIFFLWYVTTLFFSWCRDRTKCAIQLGVHSAAKRVLQAERLKPDCTVCCDITNGMVYSIFHPIGLYCLLRSPESSDLKVVWDQDGTEVNCALQSLGKTHTNMYTARYSTSAHVGYRTTMASPWYYYSCPLSLQGNCLNVEDKHWPAKFVTVTYYPR